MLLPTLRRAQFKCAETVIGQRSAGNGPNGLSYDYYYYYYYLFKTGLHLAFECFLLLDAHAQMRRGRSCCVSSK